MKKLDQLRKKIDIIDDKILKLLQNRSKLALDIGSLKNKNSKSSNLFRPERQAKILSRLFLKKNSLFNEKDISNFWKEIFFHQTTLQGSIDFLIPENLKKLEKKIIFDALGNNIIFKTYKNFPNASSKIKDNNNKFLILPFPGKTKKADWWISKYFKGLFVISAIPFVCKNKSIPKLVVVSKNKPIIEGDYSCLYVSPILIKDEKLKKINYFKSHYLYRSTNLLNYNKLKFLGAYPNLKI